MLALRFSALVRAFTKASQTAAAESGGVAFEPGDNRDSALADKIEFLQGHYTLRMAMVMKTYLHLNVVLLLNLKRIMLNEIYVTFVLNHQDLIPKRFNKAMSRDVFFEVTFPQNI